MTDAETKELAESIGMVAYFDERVRVYNAMQSKRIIMTVCSGLHTAALSVLDETTNSNLVLTFVGLFRFSFVMVFLH